MLTTVAPSQIEETLQKAWDASEHDDSCRSALFNLVAYASTPKWAEHLHALIAPLTHRFPCRVLLLVEENGPSQNGLTTEVGVDWIGDPHHPLSSETIALHFASPQRDQVPFLLTPHLLPHLPVYLLWTGMPNSTDPLLLSLAPDLTKALFAPPGVASLPSFAHKLLEVIAEISLEGVSDLQWAQTEEWRQALSTAFHAPERRNELHTLTQLELRYTSGPDTMGRDRSIEAVYLQAWLAALLGWTFAYRQGETFVYDQVKVRLQNDSSREHTGQAVLQIRGECRSGYAFTLTQDDSGRYVQFTGGSEQVCEIPMTLSLGQMSRDQILIKELFQRGTSDHYRRTIALIGRYHASSTS